MKKLIFTLIAPLALVGCNKNITAPNDADNMRLKGKVKQVTEVTQYNNIYGKRTDTTFYTFNEKGFFTQAERRMWFISEDNSETHKETFKRTFKYPAANTIEMIGYDNKGTEIQKTITKINDKGFPTEIENERIGGEKYKMHFSYSKEGTVAETTFEVDSQTLEQFLVVTYNPNGQTLTEETYPKKGAAITRKKTFTYNDKGFISSVTLDDLAQSQAQNKITYQYQYDSKGSATEIKEYNNGELSATSKRTIEYY